jgi:hypothetical protein
MVQHRINYIYVIHIITSLDRMKDKEWTFYPRGFMIYLKKN